MIYEDNQSPICLARNAKFHGRVKHINIKPHFIREQVATGNMELHYCKFEEMIADVLTKGFSSHKFMKLRGMIGVPLCLIPISCHLSHEKMD